jgi:hypothetical protein
MSRIQVPSALIIALRLKRSGAVYAGVGLFGEHTRKLPQLEYREVGSISRWPELGSAEASESIHALAEALPQAYPNGTPVGLPIYVHVQSKHSGIPWEGFLEHWARLSADNLASRFRFIRLSRDHWQVPLPLRLPIRVLAVGDRAWQALGSLREEHWYAQQDAVRKHGLVLETVSPRTFVRISRRGPAPEIVVCEDIPEVRKALLRMRSPRLVVALQKQPQATSLGGFTVVLGDGPATEAALLELFLAIVHDLPLQDAAAQMRLKGKPVLMCGDPGSAESLRMSSALRHVQRQAMVFVASTPGVRVDSTKLVRLERSDALARLEDIQRQTPSVAAFMAHVAHLSDDFRHETSGLVPLVTAARMLPEARQAASAASAQLAVMAASDPQFASLAREEQQRRVDAQLERLAPNHRSTSQSLWVDPGTALEAGRPYRLRVAIGQRLLGSLFAQAPPPLDALLPDKQDGHDLQVAVFGLDFEVTSATLLPTHLPRTGPAEAVTFDVVAPDKSGPVRLRFAIFYGNQMLQSFLLTTRTSASEQFTESGGLEIALEFSRTKRFDNLGTLGKRLACLGVNDGPGLSSHTFMWKQKKQSGSLQFDEKLLADTIEPLRKKLFEAIDNQWFPSQGPGVRSPAFDQLLTELATVGARAYRQLFLRAPRSLAGALSKIREESDQVLQIVRHDPNYAFPWSLLYDFSAPKAGKGEAPCPGFVVKGKKLVACEHTPDTKTVCARGFWGVRHVLEELIVADDASREPTAIQLDRAGNPIRLALGANDDPATNCAAQLRTQHKGEIVDLTVQEDLLDLLYDAKTRPAELIVLGHLEAQEDGETVGIGPSKTLSSEDLVERYIKAGPWEPARPLVLLLACGSGAQSVGAPGGLLLAFTRAGAPAIAATECPVKSKLLGRFACSVSEALFAGTSVGRAVSDFRRELLSEFNPMGFVFTAFGDSELKILRVKAEDT